MSKIDIRLESMEGRFLLSAVWYAQSGRMSVTNDNRAQASRDEDDQRRREAAARAEAEARENATKAALADCRPAPKIVGGPWFSSTYDVAANDMARRKDALGHPIFLCVKTIEYVSAAPNAFGGNAARAQFTGYRARDLQPVSEIVDFAY